MGMKDEDLELKVDLEGRSGEGVTPHRGNYIPCHPSTAPV